MVPLSSDTPIKHSPDPAPLSQEISLKLLFAQVPDLPAKFGANQVEKKRAKHTSNSNYSMIMAIFLFMNALHTVFPSLDSRICLLIYSAVFVTLSQ